MHDHSEIARRFNEVGLQVILDCSPEDRGEEAVPGLPWCEVIRRRRFGGPGPFPSDIQLLINVFQNIDGAVGIGAAAYVGAEGTKAVCQRLRQAVRTIFEHGRVKRISVFFSKGSGSIEYDLPELAHLQEAMDALAKDYDSIQITAIRSCRV